MSAGLASGALIMVGQRLPPLGFCALTPLGSYMLQGSLLQVSVAAALSGALATVPALWTKTLRPLVPLAAAASGTAWALTFALAAWVVSAFGIGWLVLALPAAAVLVTLLPRALGAPRWNSNPLACTQERWLVGVHTARLARLGDRGTAALLALSSAALCLAATPGAPRLPLVAAAAACAGALGFGWLSLRSAQRTAATRTLRVAAVVADGPPPAEGELSGLWPAESLDYRDVAGTLARYRPLIERAARQGARVLVLPEVSVYVDRDTRPHWLEAVQLWARTYDVVIVAPCFNAELPRNELAIVDCRGLVGEHEKQYPGRNLEPPRRRKLQVGPHRVQTGGAQHTLSTAICVDLDYRTTARSARRAGAVLCVPSNDWFGGFERAHHRTAVWGAVIAGVPVVRATGHGISAVFDRAGRVIAQQSSEHGPVVLVSDVEIHD